MEVGEGQRNLGRVKFRYFVREASDLVDPAEEFSLGESGQQRGTVRGNKMVVGACCLLLVAGGYGSNQEQRNNAHAHTGRKSLILPEKNKKR